MPLDTPGDPLGPLEIMVVRADINGFEQFVFLEQYACMYTRLVMYLWYMYVAIIHNL